MSKAKVRFFDNGLEVSKRYVKEYYGESYLEELQNDINYCNEHHEESYIIDGTLDISIYFD